MLEIVTTQSEKHTLKETNLFNKETIIDFCIFLSYGKLNNNSIRKIKQQYADVKLELEKLNKQIEMHNEIRIWYSSHNSESLCNLYFLSNYIKNKKIYGIDMEYRFVSCYDKKEIEQLLSKTKEVKPKDKWDKLYKENKDMRIAKNNDLISMNFKVLDDYIISYLKEHGETKYNDLIVHCITNEILNLHGHFFYEERIDFLIEQDKIKITKYEKEKDILGQTKIVKYINLMV